MEEKAPVVLLLTQKSDLNPRGNTHDSSDGARRVSQFDELIDKEDENLNTSRSARELIGLQRRTYLPIG